MRPYPVASGFIKLSPSAVSLPVMQPSQREVSALYVPNIQPISRDVTPISPAGMSVFAPIYLLNPRMKAIENLRISPSDLPLGSKSAPPLAPPMCTVRQVDQPLFTMLATGLNYLQPVKAFLKVCSSAKNLRTDRFTIGWNRVPPL